MRTTYALIGLGILLLGVGGWYAASRTSPDTQESLSTLESIVSSPETYMELSSNAFEQNGEIPEKYTCEGEDVSPPLQITNVPTGTQSLALIMHDPDIPKQLRADGTFDHWVMFNIIPTTASIGEGETPGIEGKNGAERVGFMGSCPPNEFEPTRHRYIFTLYALKSELPLPEGSTKADVLEAMDGLVLEKAELIGTYEKKR